MSTAAAEAKTALLRAPSDHCPVAHCRARKAPHFLTCLACARETPAALRRELWTAEAIFRTHLKRETLAPHITLEQAAAAIRSAESAILAHLRLNSSAL